MIIKTKPKPKPPCVWFTNFFPVLTFCKHVTPLGGEPTQNHSQELDVSWEAEDCYLALKMLCSQEGEDLSTKWYFYFCSGIEKILTELLQSLWECFGVFCPTTSLQLLGGIPRKKITRFTYYMVTFMSWLQCVRRALVPSPVFHSACFCREGIWQYFWWVDPVKIIILIIVQCRGGKKDKLLESDKLLK